MSAARAERLLTSRCRPRHARGQHLQRGVERGRRLGLRLPQLRRARRAQPGPIAGKVQDTLVAEGRRCVWAGGVLCETKTELGDVLSCVSYTWGLKRVCRSLCLRQGFQQVRHTGSLPKAFGRKSEFRSAPMLLPPHSTSLRRLGVGWVAGSHETEHEGFHARTSKL